jgi:hypothetical protein
VLEQLIVEVAVPESELKFQVNVRLVKSYDLKEKHVLFLTFLNNTLKNLMARKGFVSFDHTGKYFNTDPKTFKTV